MYYPLTGAQCVVNIARAAKTAPAFHLSVRSKGKIMLWRGDNFITNINESQKAALRVSQMRRVAPFIFNAAAWSQ